ncbi:MAG: UMP kinase [Bacilli bacterium]|nr:UMP kinase [Bacilli bacterium]MDD7314169.1 UMP kinase [Bacilli bacterium]MDY4052602.1 UMP kinase [Bacilli bacterium]
MQRVILKLSGEALATQQGTGINPVKVKEIAEEIKNLVNENIQVGVVIGAGNIWRGREASEFMMDRVSADYMGMLATILNCLALKNTLENLHVQAVVMTSLSMPSVAEPYVREKALNHLNKNRVVIFGGGTGSPLFSTDTCAALRAKEVNASVILMAKNGVDGVYSDDPRVNKNAFRYDYLTYDQILTDHLHVMDLTAATLCSENDIKTIVFDMNVKGNITKVIKHPEIGTIITK